MLNFKHLLSIVVRQISFHICSLFPKEQGLVLCTAWFGQKYLDNTMYVYEYLLKNSNYKVLWMTHSDSIYRQLKKEGKPVAKFDSLLGVWNQIRAQAIFTTVQLSEFNSFLLTNVIHIDLGHGHPIKDPGSLRWDSHIFRITEMYLDHNFFYAICASHFSGEKLKEIIPDLDMNNIFISDYARNDVFIDKSLQTGKNLIIEHFKQEKKAIVYMPTHRSDGKFKMNMSDILPLNDIQEMCERYGYVFVIKKHFYHRYELEDFSSYPNILDITNESDIDPQVLLCQSDILITDYSACYIDYLLLDRPLLLYQYDYQYFQKHERSLYFPFNKLNIAPIVYRKNELVKNLEKLINSKVDEYSEQRNAFAHIYFENLHQNNGREKVKQILDELFTKHYPRINGQKHQ